MFLSRDSITVNQKWLKRKVCVRVYTLWLTCLNVVALFPAEQVYIACDWGIEVKDKCYDLDKAQVSVNNELCVQW